MWQLRCKGNIFKETPQLFFSIFFLPNKKKKFILLFSLKITNEISMYENTKHNNTQEGEINFISPSCIQI
ncbi:MAG TPA: hypothetical protein DDY40_00465 [Barnesiella intestinihominis]|nr:hypothetical protein [Barnesiella intestinihominis]HBO08294.1 hypothetical protein [Barnesiella sp.]HBX18672.1 hypothetical protein [Barnesiella sp.]HCP42048.1 hypothetical protein [Barnesiella intestinihominis]